MELSQQEIIGGLIEQLDTMSGPERQAFVWWLAQEVRDNAREGPAFLRMLGSACAGAGAELPGDELLAVLRKIGRIAANADNPPMERLTWISEAVDAALGSAPEDAGGHD
jgi:hypothetical protein